jgi:hypothetical protein
MGIIATELAGGGIDFPAKGCRFSIEHNIGDKHPIHIHFGGGPAKINAIEWNIRIHFTYDEFKKFAQDIINAGEI